MSAGIQGFVAMFSEHRALARVAMRFSQKFLTQKKELRVNIFAMIIQCGIV